MEIGYHGRRAKETIRKQLWNIANTLQDKMDADELPTTLREINSANERPKSCSMSVYTNMSSPMQSAMIMFSNSRSSM
jgi:hypothetical protein